MQTEFEPVPDIILRRGELLQVVSNLITNAAYAMPSGGRLCFTIRNETFRDRGGVRLTAEDTGIGIPPDNLK